jgi:hypothetical protein
VLEDNARQDRVPHGTNRAFVAAVAPLLFQDPHQRFIRNCFENQAQAVKIRGRIDLAPVQQKRLWYDLHRSPPIRRKAVVFCRMSVRLAFPTTLLEMQHMFPDENAAAACLRAVRWPDGLVCRFCGWKDELYIFENRPTVLR